MNNNPLVSVIIPCYNVAPYISETIESVIVQTYTNWECIIVDDHSTDNSWEIIENYQQDYPEKILIYKNPRKGACAARNIGMNYAKGEFIQYLDADDLLANNKLEMQLSILKDNPNSIIYCDKIDFEKTSKKVFKHCSNNIEHCSPLVFLLKEKAVYPHCWLAYAEDIKNHNWDESVLLNQDGEFFYRVLQKLDKVIYADNTYCFYRTQNKKSISRAINGEKILSGYTTVKTLENVLLSLTSREELPKVYQCLGNICTYYLYQSYPKHKSVYLEISKNKFLKYANSKYRTTKILNNLIISIFGWKFYKRLLLLKPLIR